MLEENAKQAYLLGHVVLRDSSSPIGFAEYRILHDAGGKYRISRWKSRDVQPEIIAEGLTGDEAWNFLKLIGE